ncbi:MAG: Mrp/NBP35 family ATP-binding protein [Alphaproteobacteria bacterium]
MLKQEDIYEALKNVKDPDAGVDIVSAGMVSGLQVNEGGHVLFMIEVDPQRGAALEPLRQQAEAVVAKLKDVRKVTAVLTAEKSAPEKSPANDRPADPHGMGKNPRLNLPIKKIIAVASGKGGVGKSTVAAAIAKKLAKNSQLKTGLLDGDIYGPSQPKLMGLEGYKPELTKERKIIPPEAYGVKVMSIGFMVEAEKALVWRGPMVQSALYQLFRDVQWAEDGEVLDVLIVDMPPGTGDAQLTLAQKVPVTGAVIVSTPQDIALADARKGVEMFRAVDVPILGLIENMSTHVCSHCGHEEHIFGHGGARAEAEKLGVPFLGEIPLSADIRAKADAGVPFEIDEEIITALELSVR